jgi:hypothetical protein
MVWMGETPLLTPLDLTNTHIRLKANPDGSLGGYLGGFQPWMDYWFQEAVAESFFGVDISAMYYYCEALAETDPDPVTGKNRRISATYRLDDVMPVYVLPAPDNYRAPVNLRAQNRQLIARYQQGWGESNATYPKMAAAGDKQ